MSTLYARKTTDKSPRNLRFMRTFKTTCAVYLPETVKPAATAAPAPNTFRTYRMRPDIVAALDALRDRYAERHGGVMLTYSEVLAAALSEALPIVTCKPEFR